MKANMPKSWWRLPIAERESLKKVLSDHCYDLVNKEEAELQEIWIKLSCILLHETFGFGEKRLLRFISRWDRVYRRNARNKDKAGQTAWLDAEMAKCFPRGGFPQDRIDHLKEK